MKKLLLLLLCWPLAVCADSITQTTDYSAGIYSQSGPPYGLFTNAYGTGIVTATVTAVSQPPSNPAYAQNIQITLSLSYAGPPGTGVTATVAGGGHSFTAMVAVPGYVNYAYYPFTPSYSVTYINQNDPANWTITADGSPLGITSGGTNTTPVTKTLNGGPDVQLNLNGMTPFPVSQIPSQYINQNGNVTMVISSGGTALQTISVPAALLASGNVGTFPISLPPLGTQTLSLGFVATGYTSGAGGITYTGNLTDSANVPQLLLNPDDGIINAAQIPGNRITLAPLAANATANPYNDPSLAPVILPGPTGLVTPPQATPVWVNPTVGNPSYNATTDALTNNTYRQGVANQMNQQEQIRNNLSSTVIGQTNLLNTDLQTINGDLGNLSLNGSGGGTAANTTNIEAWAQRGNDAAANATAFTRGTDPNANAAVAANMSSTWTGALSSLNVPSTLPGADFTSSDPTSLFQIALPATFGGNTIDFNPFRSDRLGPTLSAFRTALAWLAVVLFAIWAFKETFGVIKDAGKLSQVLGPKVVVAGESDGGLVVAATYMLLMVGAVAVLLTACVALYDTDWPIIGQFAALFTSGPFHSYPAQVMWMLDQVFPVATCVAVLLGRLIYLKLLAVAYVAFMAFYKSNPA